MVPPTTIEVIVDTQRPTRTFSTVSQFVERNPAFTPGGTRWLIFNEQSNGLSDFKAILRVGRKVLIDEARFFEWLDAKNSGSHRDGRAAA